MIIKVLNETPFQVLTGAFSIGPSETGYELQVGATPQDFATLFSVGANTTRMVTNVANGSYYRLKNNVGEVKVNWSRTCVTEGGGSGSGTELTPVGEFPLGAAEGTVVALASGDTVGLYQFIDGEWVLVGADDPTKLLAVNELPATAETGTVMALYQEGVPYAYWDLTGDKALFKPASGYSFNDTTPGAEKLTLSGLMATFVNGYGRNVSVYYDNGVMRYFASNGQEEEEGWRPIGPGTGLQMYMGQFDGTPLFIYLWGENDNEIQAWVGEDFQVYVSGWTAITDFDPYDITNGTIAVFQYDGHKWNETGKEPDLSKYYTKTETEERLWLIKHDIEDKELPIAAAVNELKGDFEARLNQKYYTRQEVNDIAAGKTDPAQVDVQIKDYVDPAIAEVNDTIEDKELPVSAALNKLNEDIATIDEVIPAAIVDINDRMVSSSTVKTIWRGLQNEYDAITVKDAATLYIII